MNLFKLHRLMDENNGDGNDLGGGGASTIVDDKKDDGAGAVKVDDKKNDAPKPVEVPAMADAIKTGLANGGVVADKPIVEEKKLSAEDQVKADAAATEVTRRAALPPEEKKKLDDADRDAALAKKKPDDFVLTDEDKKVLGTKAQARFQELTSFGKLHFERAERLTQENAALDTARNGILQVYKDHLVEPNDLVPLLNYNKMVKSGNLKGALDMINNTRAGLMTALGIEGEGVDLLKQFPELAARVEANEITREDALVIANSKRREITDAAVNAQNQTAQQQEQALVKAQTDASAAIAAWEKTVASTDLDFTAKKSKINAQVAAIVKDYAPSQWLPTIQRLYANITVVKAPKIPTTVLRPSGAQGGGKLPDSPLAAIRQGLGYDAAN